MGLVCPLISYLLRVLSSNIIDDSSLFDTNFLKSNFDITPRLMPIQLPKPSLYFLNSRPLSIIPERL